MPSINSVEPVTVEGQAGDDDLCARLAKAINSAQTATQLQRLEEALKDYENWMSVQVKKAM